MSYSPPSNDSVDLSGSGGYSPPSNDGVDLSPLVQTGFDVLLTWDLSPTSSSKVDGQRIYISDTSTPSFPTDYTEIASVGDTATSFTDTGVPEGSYTYAVTAFNSGGESSPTTTAKISTSPWTILIDGQKATGLLDAEDITILVDGSPVPQ